MHDLSQSNAAIDPTKVYTLDEFKRISGMGNAAMRSARQHSKHPLKVRKVGNRSFVYGQDFIDFVLATGEDYSAAASVKANS